MSSDADDIFGILVSFTILGLLLAAIVFAAFATPFIGIGVAIGGGYLAYRRSPARKEREVREHTLAIYNEAKKLAPPPGITFEHPIAQALYEMEGFVEPPPPPPICNSVEGGRYRDKLHKYIENASDPKRVDRFITAVEECVPAEETPQGMFHAEQYLTNREIEQLILCFYHHDDFFRALKRKLDENLREQEYTMPTDYKGENCAWAYLKETPLLPLEKKVIGIELTHRTEHMHILGGTGSGKTSLIQYMIAHDLIADCTVIVIDSQGQMIRKLAHIDLPQQDVSYVSPKHNLGINLFDVGYDRLRMERDSERLINAVIELLEYVLGGLIAAELTPKQQLVFQYAIQLTITIPGGNIHTFLKILSPKGTEGYRVYLDSLPPLVREFFETEFNDRQYHDTKREITWRIWSMMKNPTFARIFSAEKNPIDMYEEMETARLILIDTDADLLQKGSGFFGRLFIAQILQAAQRRFSGKHRPVYLYIDEAYSYFDENLARMLETARKANIGVILAHQQLSQVRSPEMLAAIMGNTSIKFVSGVTESDARAMAGNMHTTPDFITSQPKLHFAGYIKGQGTYSVRVPVGIVEELPQRDDYAELIEQMETRYGYTKEPPPAEIPEHVLGAEDPAAPPPDDDEVAAVEWPPEPR